MCVQNIIVKQQFKMSDYIKAGRFLTWKTLAYVTIFLIFLLEWKRYNQSQVKVPSISDHQLILEQDILNFNDDGGGDWHKGRQLLKKPSRPLGFVSSGASTTSMNEPETEVKAGGGGRDVDDDKNFGESGKYNFKLLFFTWEVSRIFIFVRAFIIWT